jgi:hypothetical protein
MKICCALVVTVLLAVWAANGIAVENTDETTAFVPSNLPIYVHGQKLDPRDGGHVVSLGREKDLMIDDVLYLPLQKYRPYVPAVESEGLFYFVDRAAHLGSDALETGGVEAAREAMLSFWKQYEDSLEVTEAGRLQYKLSYRGESVLVSVSEQPFEPEKQQPDNFNALNHAYRRTISDLEKGYMLLYGMVYMNRIDPSDAESVIIELQGLADRAQFICKVGEELVYRPEALAGGKYRLGTSEVADFVAQKNKHR